MKIALVVVAVAVACGYLFFQVFFKMAVPSYTDRITVEGLRSEVQVRTDDYGIPHLFAGNDVDLFFAQGYIAPEIK